MVTFSPVAVVSVNPEEDTLVIVPIDPPAAGPDRALEPPPDPNPPAGRLVAAGVAVAGALLAAVLEALLQAATVAITPAAAAAAMTLLRLLRLLGLLGLLENTRLTPIVEILDLRYRRERWKCRVKKPEGGCKVVQHGLRAKASAEIGKVTPRPPGSRACAVGLALTARTLAW
jgi:hypothetical protein